MRDKIQQRRLSEAIDRSHVSSHAPQSWLSWEECRNRQCVGDTCSWLVCAGPRCRGKPPRSHPRTWPPAALISGPFDIQPSRALNATQVSGQGLDRCCNPLSYLMSPFSPLRVVHQRPCMCHWLSGAPVRRPQVEPGSARTVIRSEYLTGNLGPSAGR